MSAKLETAFAAIGIFLLLDSLGVLAFIRLKFGV